MDQNNLFKNKPIEWSVKDVYSWLEVKNISEHCKASLKETIVNGEALLKLTEDNVKDTPFCLSDADAKQLIQAIDSLKYRIKLPNGGERPWTHYVEGAIDYYLNLNFPNWRNAIIHLPSFVRCDWEGPTDDMPGAYPRPNSNPNKPPEKHISSKLLAKYMTETKVAQAFNWLLEEKGMGAEHALLLRGAEISASILKLLSSVLNVELQIESKPHFLEKLKSLKEKKNESKAENTSDVASEKVTEKPKATNRSKGGNWSGELADTIILHPNIGIVIIEVKPSITEVKNGKSYDELNYAESIVSNIIMGAVMKSPMSSMMDIPIIKIVALPNNVRTDWKKARFGFTIIYKEDMNSEDDIYSWASNVGLLQTKPLMDNGIYEQLFKAFFLLSIAKFQKMQPDDFKVDECSVNLHLNQRNIVGTITSGGFLVKHYQDQGTGIPAGGKKKEHKSTKGRKAQGLVGKVQSSASLPTSTKSDTLAQKRDRKPQDNLSDAIFNELIFLNPEQMNIWNSPMQRQLISGYAATGKTVLIQNMALELIRQESTKVLIIVPPCIKDLYTQYFKKNLSKTFFNSVIADRMLIIDTVDILVDCEGIEHYNIFFDETNSVSSVKNTEKIYNRLDDMLKTNRHNLKIWAAWDGYQRVEGSKPEQPARFSESFQNLMTHFGTKSTLTTSLRCTNEVFEDWKKIFRGTLVRQGHNVHGPAVQYIPMEKRSYTPDDAPLQALAKQVAERVIIANTEGWLPYEIAVVFNCAFKKRLVQFTNFMSEFIMNKHQGANCALKLAVASNRFYEDGYVTVDTVDGVLSHEWPIVIEVDDPYNLYSPMLMKYISKSRCLLQLVTYSMSIPTGQINEIFDKILCGGGTAWDVLHFLEDISLSFDCTVFELKDFMDVVLKRDNPGLSTKLMSTSPLELSEPTSILSAEEKNKIQAITNDFTKYFQGLIGYMNHFHECVLQYCHDPDVKEEDIIEAINHWYIPDNGI